MGGDNQRPGTIDDFAQVVGGSPYLETNSPRNPEFYSKFGFDVVEHVTEDYPPMRIPTWRMTRPPHAVA